LHFDQQSVELLLLHALPLDGRMWEEQMKLLPGASAAPDLYPLGETVEEWARAALDLVNGRRLIVVGCSVGGSCAIEVARIAPDRVAALVLIGTKAAHRPDPELHAAALRTLREGGMDAAWRRYWAPLFSGSAARDVVDRARRMALAQQVEAVARGITAFHSRPSRDDFLASFARPVTIVTGADDGMPGRKISAALAAAAPQGNFHVIPECGHYAPMERPLALNAVLRSVIAAQAL
jgi:pimeloyl-[acyl-carrier protein] methyl ester esterase